MRRDCSCRRQQRWKIPAAGGHRNIRMRRTLLKDAPALHRVTSAEHVEIIGNRDEQDALRSSQERRTIPTSTTEAANLWPG